jgi:tyrosine-specific transport protein
VIVVELFGVEVSGLKAALLFTVLFAGLISWGTQVVDRINWLLMMGLVISYIALITVGVAEVESIFLRYRRWALALPALPVLFSAYGFHNIIPTISTYLARDERRLRWSITVGTLIPLVVYGLWQWLVIGTLGEEGLQQAAQSGLPVTNALRVEVANPLIGQFATFFGFFALVTSLLGVSLSVVDFLGDGLGVKNRTGWRRVALTIGALLPPFFFAQSYPDVFVEMLGVAGGYGEAFLNGLLPVAMVWVGRYQMKLNSRWRVPGGRFTLVILLAITVVVTLLETQHLLGW